MRFFLLLAVLFLSLNVQAAVINDADIGGLRTFQDTYTGRVWLDLDNFYNADATYGLTGFQMISAAEAAGFTFAQQSDVEELLNTLPLNGGEWGSYSSVMGYSHPRNLIWGMYDDGDGNPYGWAWSSNGYDVSWNYRNNASDANIIQNYWIPGAIDLGIWAYKNGSSAAVPEPAILSLLSMGLLGLAGLRFIRRRKD